MRSKVLAVCLGLFVSTALSLHAERQPFERYQSIVDRQMFGVPPAGFDPTKSPSEVSLKATRAAEEALTKEQEQVKSAVRFSVINVTPTGETVVGFTDNGNPKTPVHYYLKVGEMRDGWTVKEANPLKASMIIEKNGVEVPLTLGGTSNGAGAPVIATRGSPSATVPGRPLMMARPSLLGGGTGAGSLRERRMRRAQERQAAEAQAAEARAQAEAKAQRDAEEKAQREAEREQQRQQLLQIQDELKKAREERARRDAEQREKDAAKASEKDGEKEEKGASADSDEQEGGD